MYGIIGGSGLSRLPGLLIERERSIDTPYGLPSGPVLIGQLEGKHVAFLPRHGPAHTVAPHLINYRANIWALRESGVGEIVSVASVGGIRDDLGPETIMLPDQLIDYTWGRVSTYFQEGSPVTHVDMTEPYSGVLRQETAAEINRLERDGADIVGMTGMPEATLARELAIPYATVCVVVNHAAGRGDSRVRIRMEDLEAALARTLQRVQRIIREVVRA
jgi:purine nucleoside phosphorylase